ncbi:MAG: hypothetical protein EOS64_28310 [Mesorhizobium sp.]|nr:MAG: hypothetical protein EOS64_28310 [Mesorhizobium sp.]
MSGRTEGGAKDRGIRQPALPTWCSVQSAARSEARVVAGVLALAAIALLIGGAFAGLIFEGIHDPSGAFAAFDGYLFRVARFTLWQALLSTLLSVAPALLVARALSTHPRFPGRNMMLRLFTVPLALPAIVAALGILALYGRAGYFAGVVQAPMTAFVIILEMTGNHDNVIALMCAAVLGYGTARLISNEPLYHALSRVFIAEGIRRRRSRGVEA